MTGVLTVSLGNARLAAELLRSLAVAAVSGAQMEGDLIDEVGFNIHPVLLGAGIPAFHPMSRQIDLELKDCQRFTNGCVYVTYRVRRKA